MVKLGQQNGFSSHLDFGDDQAFNKEFDALLEQLIEEEIDEAKGRQSPRKSLSLTREQRQTIRQLAIAIARRIGHKRKGKSKRGKHQAADSRRAMDIERKALRMIDHGMSYEEILDYLRKRAY